VKYLKKMKCCWCGSFGEFTYIGSRNLNRFGELKGIIGERVLWISYFECPNCKKVDLVMHPVGEEPDVPDWAFKEVIVEPEDEKKSSGSSN